MDTLVDAIDAMNVDDITLRIQAAEYILKNVKVMSTIEYLCTKDEAINVEVE